MGEPFREYGGKWDKEGIMVCWFKFSLDQKKLVDWVGIHPQLCSEDGDVYLATLLKGSDVDELYVAGCDPNMQRKMFRDAFEMAGFPRSNHKGIEIRNLDTDGAYTVIKENIETGI